MSSVAGEVEVLVRPVTTGFAAAAEPGIAKEGRDIGRDLSKAILAGFAIGGVVEGIKSVVEAATKQNSAFAVLDQTLKNAGQSVVGFSASLHDKLEAQARATGVSAEDLAGAMSRLIPVTGNVGKSVKDLNTAIGISETFHISLSTAALALAKAETGSYTSLQRYLGLIPKVTMAEDNLKARYNEEIALHGALDTADKQRYEAALQVAVAQDKAATSTQALAAAQAKFAGVPQTFAQTYEGQFNRLHVAVDQLKVAVGTELVGGLASGSAALADWIDKLLESNKAQQDGAELAHEVGSALHEIGSIAETVGPPLLSVAKALEDVVSAIGAPALIAGAVAYKGVAIASGLAASAQALYARAVAATTPAVGEATAANVALAASETAVGAAGEEAAAGGIGSLVGGLAELGVGAAASPAGIAVGVGVLAAVIYKLSTQETAWASANHAVTGSLQSLTAATDVQDQALGRLARAAAARNVAAATRSTIAAVAALGTAATGTTLPNVHSLGPGSVVPGATAANLTLQNQAQLQQKVALETGKNVQAEQKFIRALEQQALALGKQNPLLSHNLDLIGTLAEQIKKVPTRAEIAILINNKNPTAGLADVLSGLTKLQAFFAGFAPRLNIPDLIQGSFKLPDPTKKKLTEAATEAMQTLAQGIASDKSDLQQIKTNLADAITQGAQAVTDAVTQAKTNLNTIGQSLASEIQTILVKPITDAQTALTAAQDKLGIASSRSALTTAQLTLRNLGQSVLLPGGKTLSQDPTKALAQLNALEKKTGSPALRDFITQYQSGIQGEQSAALGVKSASLTVSNDKLTGEANSAATRLTNLTDLVNTGRLTKTAFGSRVGSLLKNLGITPAAAAREFGVSGADTLKGLEQGLLGQAGAITAGPQRVGSGLIPSITRPLQTLHEQNRQINQLRHEEAAKELDEQKKQTKLLTDIANGKAAAKFTSSLDQNPGTASKRTKKLTGVTR